MDRSGRDDPPHASGGAGPAEAPNRGCSLLRNHINTLSMHLSCTFSPIPTKFSGVPVLRHRSGWLEVGRMPPKGLWSCRSPWAGVFPFPLPASSHSRIGHGASSDVILGVG